MNIGQRLTTNALKHLIDQSEERILQIVQSKNASKHLQHHVDRTPLSRIDRKSRAIDAEDGGL